MSDEESLSSKVVKGGFWVFATRIFERGLGFIRIIILARVLSPDDFGLFGILMLAISTLETFSQTGFKSALVQKKEDIKSHLDTAWTILSLRGILLYTLLFLAAPLIGDFFDAPRASFFIRIIGLTTIFRGFGNIGTVYFQKEIQFDKKFILQLVTNIVEFIVAVILAYTLRNVWALVISQLIGGFSGLITGYIIHPYRPKFNFDKEKAKELFTFGKWITGSNITNFIITQGDDAFISKYLGTTQLGFYQLAYKISNTPTTEITHLISKTIYPAYSKIQDNIHRLKESFFKVLTITIFISAPISLGIISVAPIFTDVFLGNKWISIIPIIQILTIWGLIRSIGATTGPLFKAIGKPNYITTIHLVKIIILIIVIYPLTKMWGIVGTSISVVINSFFSIIIALYLTIKKTKSSLKMLIKSLAPPLISSLIMYFIIYISKTFLFESSNIINFTFLVIVGIVVYILQILIIDKTTSYNVINIIKDRINQLQ